MSKKVLITDDSMFMRRMLRQICENFSSDLEIKEATNGLDALNQCKELAPDLIFMDITMPQMNGIEATKRIKEKYPQIKVVICSAIAETEQAKEAIKFGAQELIAKPFQAEKISAVLNLLL